MKSNPLKKNSSKILEDLITLETRLEMLHTHALFARYIKKDIKYYTQLLELFEFVFESILDLANDERKFPVTKEELIKFRSFSRDTRLSVADVSAAFEFTFRAFTPKKDLNYEQLTTNNHNKFDPKYVAKPAAELFNTFVKKLDLSKFPKDELQDLDSAIKALQGFDRKQCDSEFAEQINETLTDVSVHLPKQKCCSIL